jgi:hypothetical protein
MEVYDPHDLMIEVKRVPETTSYSSAIRLAFSCPSKTPSLLLKAMYLVLTSAISAKSRLSHFWEAGAAVI